MTLSPQQMMRDLIRTSRSEITRNLRVFQADKARELLGIIDDMEHALDRGDDDVVRRFGQRLDDALSSA